MRTLLLGCNHRTAPVETRERIAFDEETLPLGLAAFKEQFPDAEIVLLSTCNRVEFYVARPVEGRPRFDDIIRFIAQFHKIEPHRFADRLYTSEDLEAARHLFRVVSALDSMVIGESQIIGQSRGAYDAARSAGTVGRVLGPLFERALSTARHIHTSTGIATGRLSIGSTAVDLARQVFSHFDDKTILMVGAGKMGELTLLHLLEQNPRRLWVTNRTDKKAVELADRLSRQHRIETQPIPFADWIARLADVDIVITCTGSAEPILTAEQFDAISRRRSYSPILLIDIAVPRDIHPAVADIDSVFLYNIDDLQAVTEANLAHRKDAIDQCTRIIESAVIECLEQQSRSDIHPLIAALQARFHDVGQSEWERILPKLEAASEHDRQLIQQMLHRTLQKLLHAPIEHLNSQRAAGSTRVYADTLRALFNLEDES